MVEPVFDRHGDRGADSQCVVSGSSNFLLVEGVTDVQGLSTGWLPLAIEAEMFVLCVSITRSRLWGGGPGTFVQQIEYFNRSLGSRAQSGTA